MRDGACLFLCLLVLQMPIFLACEGLREYDNHLGDEINKPVNKVCNCKLYIEIFQVSMERSKHAIKCILRYSKQLTRAHKSKY